MSRGNEQKEIFRDDTDRRNMLEILEQMSERFDISIYAFVLMNTHYHILARTHHPNLSKAMQWFGATYSRRFNIRHSRCGHLFQGRYKSIIVENDAYLIQLSCYIHRNPLREGIVKRLVDYPWSSYPAYAYRRKAPQWLSMNLILSQFAGQNRRKKYRENVQHYAREEKSLWEDYRHGIFLGSKSFVDRMRKKHLSKQPHTEIPSQSRLARDVDPNKLLNKVAHIMKLNAVELSSSKRLSGQKKDDRDLLIYIIWKTGILTNEKIGQLFGLTYSSVSHSVRSFKSKLKKDAKLKKKFYKLNSQFKM